MIPSPTSPHPATPGRVKKELRPWSREVLSSLYTHRDARHGGVPGVSQRKKGAERTPPEKGKTELRARRVSPPAMRQPPVVGMIDLSSVEDNLPVVAPSPGRQVRGGGRDAGPPTHRAATARQETTAGRPLGSKTTAEPGRWRGSQGRLLTLDEKGPHNRAHNRRDSFPPPRTAPQQERIQTAGSVASRLGTGHSGKTQSSSASDKARHHGLQGDPDFIRMTTSAISNRLSTSPTNRWSSSIPSPYAEVSHLTAQTPVASAVPVPRIPVKSEFHSWEDPFIPERRAQLERSRQIKSQTVVETFFADSKPHTARERKFLLFGPNHDKNLPLSARQLSEVRTRRSSQSSRLVKLANLQALSQNSFSAEISMLSNMVEKADVQARYAMDKRQQASSRGLREIPHSFYEIPWHIPTYNDHHHHQQVRGEHFTEFLGQKFQSHLTYDIIGKEMEKVKWGDRKAPKEQCGLRELDEGLTRTKKRNEEFLKKMTDVASFLQNMQTPKNKQTILEGRALAQATMGEAIELLDDLDGLCPDKDEEPEVNENGLDPEFDVRNLRHDNLDTMLKNLVLMNDRGAMFNAERKLQKHSARTEAPEKKDDVETDGRRFMRANEMMDHAALHRDLAYCRFKTSEFQRAVEGSFAAEGDCMARRIHVKQGLKVDKSLHYLRFTILQATYLPIMDDTKRTNDAYVRCGLYYEDRISAGAGEKEQTVCTKVAWNTKRPVWNQEYTFSVPYHPSARVCLLLEVMDTASVEINANPKDEFGDEDTTAKAPADIVLGQVEFLILSGGMQVMSPEHEYADSYFLCESDGSGVRDNFGVRDAVLKGRSSTLDVRHVYTKRPRLSKDDYVVLLQSNIRCRASRQRLANERQLQQLLKTRDESLERFTASSEEKLTWTRYVKKCTERGTHPVASLKGQITSGGLFLTRYSLNAGGVSAVTFLTSELLRVAELTALSLTHVDLSSDAVAVLADGLCSMDNCELAVLTLDGNPLSKEPADRSQDAAHAKPNRNSYSVAGARAVARMVDRLKRLSGLSVSSCQLGSEGVKIVADSVRLHRKMTRFNISDNMIANSSGNNFLAASTAMGNLLLGNDTLLELVYEDNNLNRQCGNSFFGGSGFPDHGLLYNYNLRTLRIAKTGCCRTSEGVQNLSRVLSETKNSLEVLDISSCGLTGQHIHMLNQGLNASELSTLILDGNPIQVDGDGYGVLTTRHGKKKFIMDLVDKVEKEKVGHAKNRLAAAEVQTIFDAHSHMGLVRLTDKLQMKRLLDDLGFAWDLNEVMSVAQEMDLDNSDSIDFQEFFQWYRDKMKVTESGDAILEISIRQCGAEPKDALFNVEWPSGSYDLDMYFLRSRNILRALMRLEYGGKGRIIPGSVKRVTITAAGEEVVHPYDLVVYDDVSIWSIPKDGWVLLEFESKNNGHFQSDENGATIREMTGIEHAFKQADASVHSRCLAIEKHLLHKTSLLYRQASQILKWFPSHQEEMVQQDVSRDANDQDTPQQAMAIDNSNHIPRAVHVRHLERKESTGDMKKLSNLDWERINFVVRVLPMLCRRRRDLRIIGDLGERERRATFHRLCILDRNAIYRNPAAYYRFNLSRLAERDSCITLVSLTANDFKEASSNFRDFGARHQGGTRDKVELVWRNARIDGRILKLEKELNMKDYSVPYAGILEVDFVDIRKPDEHACAMSAADFKRTLDHLNHPRLTAAGRMEEILDLSYEHYFTCLQVVLLLQLFKGADLLWRAEVCFCLFARTVDWRAYHYVLSYSGSQAGHVVRQRIGRLNLFFDGASSAVGYWKLNLALNDERYIMQELLHFAAEEKGQNLADCKYNGVPFEIPISWTHDEVPRMGQISLFYVRTVDCNSRMITGGRSIRGFAPNPKQYPPNFIVPSVPEYFQSKDINAIHWIFIEKVRLIKETLQIFVDSVEEVFGMLDVDGSKTIERDEFSRGLFQAGIQLQPSEMRMLLDIIDVDKNNVISLQEFEELWEQAPPLRMNDEAQAMFWCVRNVKATWANLDRPLVNKRGVRGRAYGEIVDFYDIRALYSGEEVEDYGLSDPKVLSVY